MLNDWHAHYNNITNYNKEIIRPNTNFLTFYYKYLLYKFSYKNGKKRKWK